MIWSSHAIHRDLFTLPGSNSTPQFGAVPRINLGHIGGVVLPHLQDQDLMRQIYGPHVTKSLPC